MARRDASCPLRSFPGCCAAPSARLRASSTRYGGAVLIRGPPPVSTWVPALRSSVKDAAPRPGRERNVLSQPCGDLPVGQFCVESPLQKYFRFHTPQITSITFRIPPHRGALAIVTKRGAGCGGR